MSLSLNQQRQRAKLIELE